MTTEVTSESTECFRTLAIERADIGDAREPIGINHVGLARAPPGSGHYRLAVSCRRCRSFGEGVGAGAGEPPGDRVEFERRDRRHARAEDAAHLAVHAGGVGEDALNLFFALGIARRRLAVPPSARIGNSLGIPGRPI